MQLEKWHKKRNVQIQADSKSARDIGLSIKELQQDLEKDKKNKLKEKGKFKERRAFNKLPEFSAKMEFWCDHCQIDFVAPAWKQWIVYSGIGTWQSFCPICEGWVYRHITAKVLDPYYFKSEKIRNSELSLNRNWNRWRETGWKHSRWIYDEKRKISLWGDGLFTIRRI